MEKPRWLQLIEAHQQLGGKYGLTVPFLVGGLLVTPKGRKAIAPHDPGAAVRTLFASILDEMPAGRIAYVHQCRDLGGQPVVALHDDAGYSLPNPLVSPLQNRRTLFVEDVFVSAENHSLETLAARFASDFSADIAAANFSFRGGTYGSFSENDYQLIEISRAF